MSPSRDPRAPGDIDAERAVLGALLLGPTVGIDPFGAVTASGLTSADFVAPKHLHTYDALTALRLAGQQPDVLLVAAELERRRLIDAVGGVEYLHGLLGDVPSISNVGKYADIVRKHARHRQWVLVASDLGTAALAGDDEAIARILVGRVDRVDRPGGYHLPDVGEAWKRLRRGLNPIAAPTVLPRSDGVGLFHEDADVLIFGPGGAAKTMLVQHAVICPPLLGKRVAWLDLDNMGLDVLVARFAQLGAGDIHIRTDTFAYFDRNSFDNLDALLLAAEAVEPDVTVVDSLIGALALAEVDKENDNLAVRAVLQRIRDVVRRRATTPRTNLIIDHVGIEAGRARGATAKLQAVDQGVEVTVIDPPALGQTGTLRLISRKDRRGQWADRRPIADVVIDSTRPMPPPFTHLRHATVVIADPPRASLPAELRRMETISLAAETAGAGTEVRWADLRKQEPVSMINNAEAAAARNRLVDDGYFNSRSGPRRAILLTLVKPFRADKNET